MSDDVIIAGAGWEPVRGLGNFTGLATLPPETQQKIKIELETLLSAYRQPAGEYFIPHACRLIWGQS